MYISCPLWVIMSHWQRFITYYFDVYYYGSNSIIGRTNEHIFMYAYRDALDIKKMKDSNAGISVLKDRTFLSTPYHLFPYVKPNLRKSMWNSKYSFTNTHQCFCYNAFRRLHSRGSFENRVDSVSPGNESLWGWRSVVKVFRE